MRNQLCDLFDVLEREKSGSRQASARAGKIGVERLRPDPEWRRARLCRVAVTPRCWRCRNDCLRPRNPSRDAFERGLVEPADDVPEIGSGQALENKVWKSMIEILAEDFRQRHAKRMKEAIEAHAPDQRGAVGLRTRPHHDLLTTGAGNLENKVSAAGRKSMHFDRRRAERHPGRGCGPLRGWELVRRRFGNHPSFLITSPISNS